MNGAEALLRTLIDSNVDVCFANPGTSEMYFVAALDRHPGMRGVLCLFEGVATGAADGWARMTGRPAATLLHLGPGLSNGLANLHNARRARTPVVNVVGDHAYAHKPLDSPLESDIDAAAATVSSWVRRPATAGQLGSDTAAVVAAALGGSEDGADPSRTGTSGSVATLVVPADLSWSDDARPAPPVALTPLTIVTDDVLAAVAALLTGPEPAALMVDGAGLARPDCTPWPGSGRPPGRPRSVRPGPRDCAAGPACPQSRH